MMRFLVIANRALYGATLVATAGLAAALAGGRSGEPDPALPLQVAAIALPAAQRHDPMAFVDRNIFDPDGKPWEAVAAADAKAAKAADLAASTARGLILLPGLEGVLTDNGFIAAGQAMPEGALKRVTDSGYVVAGSGGEREVKFDAERERAIAELLHPSAAPAPAPRKPAAAAPAAAKPMLPATGRQP